MGGFNDWDASVLLLAKDANPMQTFRRRIEEGDAQPWRHGQPWEKGGSTNTHLQSLAAEIPGTKLYGSVMARSIYKLSLVFVVSRKREPTRDKPVASFDS